MMNKTLFIKGLVLSVIFQIIEVASFGLVFAGQYNYAIFSSAEMSDNILQSSNKESGHSVDTGLNFSFSSDVDHELVSSFNGAISHETYSQSQADDQIYKQASALLVWEPRTNNFSLRLLDELSQVPQNRYTSQQLGNYRDSNVVSVNPEYFFKMNSLERLNFSADFIKSKDEGVVNAAGAVVDASRFTQNSSVSYQRELSSTSRIYLVYARIDTDFAADVSQGAVDYVQDDLFVRWVVHGRATRLQLELGRSDLVDEFNKEKSVTLRELSVTRQINYNNELVFFHRSGFNNMLNLNFSSDSVDVGNPANNLLSAQITTETSFAYRITSDHLNLSFRMYRTLIEGAFEESEELQRGADFNITYPVSRLFGVTTNSDISFTYSKTKNSYELENAGTVDNGEEQFQLSFNYNYSPTLTFFISMFHRRNSEGVTGSEEFEVETNRLGLGFSYSPSGRF